MKRVLVGISLLLGILLLLLMLPACAKGTPAPAETPQMTLRFADLSPGPTSGPRDEALVAMLTEVEKNANGKVKVEYYWGESLLKSAEMLRGVMTGSADIAMVSPSYYPTQLLLQGMFDTIAVGPTDPANIYWVHETIHNEIPAFNAELAAWNQRIVFRALLLPRAIWSTKPIKTIDDLKGLKIRTSGEYQIKRLEAAGAVPVSMPITETYTAMQKGTIDGVMTNLDAMTKHKHYEVAKNVFLMKQSWSPDAQLYTMNLDTWNKLPKDIQQIFTEAGGINSNATKLMRDLFVKGWDDRVELLKKEEVTVNSMSSADAGKWVTISDGLGFKTEWVKKADARGLPGADIMKRVEGLVAQGIAKDK